MLCEKLTAANRSRCSNTTAKGVLSLHDNAHPHTAIQTAQTSSNCTPDVLEHPPYTNDFLQTSTSWFTMKQ
jgi:hypothetical protein